MEKDNTEKPKGFFAQNPILVFVWAVVPIVFVFGTTLFTAAPDSTAIDGMGNLWQLGIAQIISVVILFVVPAILLSYVYKRKVLAFLHLLKLPTLKEVALVITLIFSGNLFLNYLIEINELIPLSEGLKMKFSAMQDSTIAMQEKFLAFNTFPEFLLILVVMAVLPAIAEEIYFRGLIQGVLIDLRVGAFHAIFISSLLFAMIHFQFYYLIALFFMGALLGYIYYRTKNLWLSILVHFLNNGLIVMLSASNKMELTQIDLDGEANPLVSLAGLLAFISILYYFHKSTANTKFE